MSWVILGRISEASEDVCEDAEVVHSERMVVLCAMHELDGEKREEVSYPRNHAPASMMKGRALTEKDR